MKKIVKTCVLFGLAVCLALFGVIAYNTLTYTSMQMDSSPAVMPEVPMEWALAALQDAIRIPTISKRELSEADKSLFLALHRTLEHYFPRVHETLSLEGVNELSLLYTWRGTDTNEKAVLLLAHQDVVPVPDADSWTHPPFSGAFEDGFVWGRGALDDKGSMIGILAAVELLLERGFVPRRDIYLCFGHDEEIGGWEGAAAMAALLHERGVTAEFSLDEGMAIVDGDMLGMEERLAFVALTEKGYLSLELTARGEMGHSSTPPRETALGILAAAVTRLEGNPMPARLPEPARLTFRYLGPEMRFPMNVLFANLWLTKPLILRQLSASRVTDAITRTTTAVTIMEGGAQDNVLPPTGRAVVNFRLKPGDTIASVTERVRALVADERIEVAVYGTPNEAPPVSRVDVPAFDALHATIRQVFPDVLVAPTMMLGGSDSHHYALVAENTYGFSPLYFTEEDLERIHGPNERIDADQFERMIGFYVTLLDNVAG